MREKLKKNIKYVLSSALIIIILSGCLKENNDTTIFVEDGDKFHLTMPTSAVVITRSDAVPSDSKINIDGYSYIFAFDYNSGLQKSRLVLTSEHIKYNDATKATILVSSAFENDDRIVFVFNAELKAGEKLADVTYLGDKGIDAMFLKNGSESATIGSKGMPMYGEIKFNSSTVPIPAVAITRAVARVQVIIPKGGLYVGSGTEKDFNIGTVTYNIYQKATSGNIREIENGVNSATMNSDPISAIGDETEINNKLIESNSNNSIDITYLYEYQYSTKTIKATGHHELTNSVSDSRRLAIILKQSVGGDNKFYRLDLCNQTGGNISYLDIKRNNHYKVNITKVNSVGYDTATQALMSPASNIEYEIIDDTGEEVISDGQYALSIGKQPLSGETRYHAELPDIATLQADGSYELVLSDKVKYILPTHMTELPSGVTATIELISNVIGVRLKSTQLTKDIEDVTLIIPANVAVPTDGLTARFRVKLGNIHYLSSSVRLIHPAVREATANCIIVHPTGNPTVTVPINNINIFWGPGGEGTVSFKAKPDNSSYDRDYLWENAIDDVDYNVRVISNTVAGTNPTVITKTAESFTINGLTNGAINGSIIVGVYRSDDLEYKECLWSWHLWVSTAQDITVNTNWGTNGESPYNIPIVELTMLDRDLGDKTNWTTFNVDVFSYYQWGRKDPLVSGGSTTATKYFYESVYDPTRITFSDANKGHGGTVDRPSLWSSRWDSSDQLHNPCPDDYKLPPTSLLNRTPYLDNWNSERQAPINLSDGLTFWGDFGWVGKNGTFVFTANSTLNLGTRIISPLGTLHGRPYHAMETWSSTASTSYIWDIAPTRFGTEGTAYTHVYGDIYKAGYYTWFPTTGTLTGCPRCPPLSQWTYGGAIKRVTTMKSTWQGTSSPTGSFCSHCSRPIQSFPTDQEPPFDWVVTLAEWNSETRGSYIEQIPSSRWHAHEYLKANTRMTVALKVRCMKK